MYHIRFPFLAECQAGMFSPTGYEPCKPCPTNFYQVLTGQKGCLECPETQITNSTGSNSSNQCWTPELCPASPTPCSGNGSCSVKNHEKFCNCNSGYSGSDCQLMNNFCDESPCVRGTCNNNQGISFTCTCDTGFTGDRCDRDTTNRCTPNTCQAGSCRNIKNGADCLCPLTGGFTQPSCERLDNLCAGIQCSNGGTCVAFGSVRKQCLCQPGYTGENCEININECTLNPQGCLYNGTCSDGVNAYSCQCRPGFSGNRCHVRNNFCSTDPCADAECYNDYDNYKSVCVCHDGFEVQDAGNGKCTSTVKCPLGNAFCNNGSCNNDKCFCLNGYTGSRCQHDFTDCTMNSCKNGGTCVDKHSGFDCMCMSGYTGNDCSVNINDCLGQCQGEHVISTSVGCMDKVNDFMCNCEAGWTGKNCTENIDECASYPCRHGASCTDGDNTYTCNCTIGWTGQNCDTAINNCPDNKCKNEGNCFNMNEGFFCSCLGGTTGKTCSNFPPVCNTITPCTAAKGQCVDEEGTAKCDCIPNYTGSSCQLTTYHCGTDPCQNDGTCVTGSGMDFSCNCRDSYYGTNCDGYTDPCSSKPCTPGANCLSDKDKYLCSCPGGAVPTDNQCKSSAPIGELSVDGMVDTRGTYLNNPFVFSNADMFSVMLWVLCSNDTYNNPIILALEERDIHHQEPGWMDSPPTSNYLLKVTNEGVVFDNGTDLKMVEFGKNICDKIWHHVSVTYHKNGTTYVKLDSTPKDPFTQTVPRSFSKVFQVLLGQSFLGKISQVMIWNKILSTSDQFLAFGNVYTIPDPNEIVQKWMNYAQTKSVTFSSTITVHDNNPTLEDEFQMTADKMPPTVVSCPPFRKEFPMPDEQIVNFPGLKNSISFNHPTDITKYSSVADGESYTRGRIVLVFYAIDGMKNFAMCRFPLYVQYDDCPAPVFNGALTDFTVGSNMKAHKATCSNNLAISGPIPEFFHCTNLGVYNPDEPYDSFLLPACGAVGITSYQVAVDLLYDLVISCKSADLDVFVDRLSTRLRAVGVCKPNCVIVPNLRCETLEGKLLRVSFTLTGLEEILSVPVDGVSVTFLPFEALTYVVYNTDTMDFELVTAGAILRKNVQSITITQSMSCASGYQLVGEQCVQCSAGQYYDTNTKMCKFCQKNTYLDEAGQTICKPCDGNKVTLNEGATSQSLCVENCTAGNFYNKSSTSCQVCAKNFYQENNGMDYCAFCPIQKITTGTGSDSFTDCNDDCPVGEERVESNQACVQCPIGMYRTQLNVKCIPCPSEFTTEQKGTTDESGCNIRICYNGTFRNKSNSCEDCATGYYQDENFKDECKKCPSSESTRNMGSNSSSQCEFVCGAGEEIITGQRKCKQCDRRFYHTGDHPDIFDPCSECPTNKTTEVTGSTHRENCTIEICAMGQEVNSSGDSCIDCPYNTFQDKDVPTSHQRCVQCSGSKATKYMKTISFSDCLFYCPLAGTQDDGNGNCMSCPRGTFRSVDDHSTAFLPCENCTAGKTTETTGSMSSHNCSIDICSKGQELNNTGACLDCPYDFYQDIEMPKSVEKCKPCDSNKATDNMKSTSNNDCKRYCKEPGTELNDQDMCVPCARGTYRSIEDRTKYFAPCMNCSNGRTTEGPGSISSVNCSIDMCSAGEVLNSAGNCERCPKGSYQPITYPNSAVTCTKCPSNKATMDDGQTSEDSCVRVCSAGQQYNNVSDQCEPCDKGTWNNANETMKFQQCASCPVNYTTTGGSSTDLSNCTVLDCDPGSYISGDNCLLCPLGTYQPDRYQASCKDCGSNQNTSETGRTMESDCQIWCGPGLAGSTTCQKCPLDTIKPQAGLSNCVSCEESFANFTSNENRISCDVLFCDKGFQYNGTSSPARCDPCKQGEYKEARGRATLCVTCPPGFTTSGEASTDKSNCDQLHCVKGEYYDSTNQSCQQCPIGSYKDTVGNTNCTTCGTGFTTAITGATSGDVCTVVVCPAGQKRIAITNSCEVCPIGQYQPNQGESNCIPCSPGTYTTRTTGTDLQSDCVDNCSPGYEYNTTSRVCVACGLGTYKSQVGNWKADQTTVINCTSCPPLKTTTSAASTSSTACSLDLCDVGTYQKDGACVSCEKAKYQDEKGQTECKSCGAGKTTKVFSGATSIVDCIPDCPLGKDHNLTSSDCCCTDCAISYYVDKSKGEYCIKCPTGTTNLAPGSVDCPYTDSTPTVKETVTVVFRLRLNVLLDCANENSKSIYANNVKIKLVAVFKTLRFDVCSTPSCDNIASLVVVFPNSGGCNQGGGSRRKRNTGTIVDLDVSVNSLPNPATSTDNSGVKRPIQDVINEMINTNPSSIAPQGSTLDGASVTSITQQCIAGQVLTGTACGPCPVGTYENSGTCANCPVNQYQDVTGQTTCKQCSSSSSINIYTAGTNSTSVSQCLSTCEVNSNYCKNGGTCVASQTVYCQCGSRYSGTNCENRSEPDDSTWIYIVAGTIGGLVFLLIIIIISVVFCRRSSSPKTKIVYEKQDPSQSNHGYQSYPDAVGYPYQQAMIGQQAMSQALPETYYMPYHQPYQQPRAITNRQYRGFEVDEDNSSAYKWTSFSEH
ncbi:Fibropellin-1 [Mizuhopecten yessoensis]|uniref:Fibropellin-1 n=1 Tax=Mizuhopecten yessoensis TaxID=6573 RepID=A0A210QV26_MIZYE|nr:Fibropellin-1 [Mizuhopecten yessoensis]